MRKTLPLAACLLALLPLLPVRAETVARTNGTDRFMAGSATFPDVPASGEVFAAGASVVLRGHAGGDTHVAGFDVQVEAPVDADLYAAGANVTVRAPVGEDITAMGFNLRTAEAAAAVGNVRLTGGTVVVEGPVGKALTALGGEVTLNASVGGDVLLSADKISFGPKAHIGGRLVYSAPSAITIPPGIVAADHVTFEERAKTDIISRPMHDWSRPAFPVMPSFFAIFSAFLVGYGFLLVLSALLLAFLPALTERLRAAVDSHPGKSFLWGFFGLSALFGVVPVAAMTILGLPLVPFAVLGVILGWLLGYLLGVFVVAMRVFSAFGLAEQSTLLMRLVVVGAGLLVAWGLNFVPLVGWIFNFALVLLGLGGIVQLIFPPSAGRAAIAKPAE